MIEIKNLTKKYGNTLAVDNLSLTIDKHGVYGLLGPNGAGKSTTMNILTGYLAPTSGDILINHFDILKEPQKAKACIGYLPEIPPLYLDMTVKEMLLFVAEIRKIDKAKREEEVSRVMKEVEIADVKNRLIKNLSKGYRQRVGMAVAIVGSPENIILDEPTVGLDPKQIIEIRDLIRTLGKKHTVILSSHILSEVSEICEHVFIISQGKLVMSEETDNLANYSSSQELEIIAKGEKSLVEDTLRVLPSLAKVFVEDGKEAETVVVHVTAKEKDDVREDVSMALQQKNISIFGMKEMGQSLEDVFLELTSQEEGKK